MRAELLDVSLLPAGSRVLCAVSGGADSVCLLSLLRERGEYELFAAHFNHCLRGEESERDERFVRSLCADWGVPLYTEREDIRRRAERDGLSLESAAREARYEFLHRTAARCGAELIATAHTARDQAETVLFRMSRGTGLRGLTGIPRQRGNIVRPLLRTGRREIEDYLAERGIPHVEDSTNAADDAARNRIRHGAIPALESVNSAAVENILRMSERLGEDEAYLEAAAAERWSELWDGESLSLPGLCALPKALSRRILNQAAGRRLTLREGDAVLALWESHSPSAGLDLPSLRAERRYERLFFLPPGAPPGAIAPRELRAGESVTLEEAGFTVFTEYRPAGSEIQSSFNTFSFSYGMICGALTVSSRREGDSIRLAHRDGVRSLRRLMIDAKIPRQQRGEIPVLRDGEGVLAVWGFGQALRAKARPGEEHWRVSIRKNRENTEEERV